MTLIEFLRKVKKKINEARFTFDSIERRMEYPTQNDVAEVCYQVLQEELAKEVIAKDDWGRQGKNPL